MDVEASLSQLSSSSSYLNSSAIKDFFIRNHHLAVGYRVSSLFCRYSSRLTSYQLPKPNVVFMRSLISSSDSSVFKL